MDRVLEQDLLAEYFVNHFAPIYPGMFKEIRPVIATRYDQIVTRDGKVMVIEIIENI
jgi:hypothetical protein